MALAAAQPSPQRLKAARAQVWTLRERRLKLGARAVSSVRLAVLYLPESFPILDDFRKVAHAPRAAVG